MSQLSSTAPATSLPLSMKKALREAMALHKKKKHQAAWQTLQPVLSAHPSHVPALNLQMELARHTRQLDVAMLAAVRSLSHDKMQPGIAATLADMLCATGRMQEALPYLKLACMADKKHQENWFRSALIYWRVTRDKTQAFPYLEHALTLPGSRRAECHRLAGEILAGEGDELGAFLHMVDAIDALDLKRDDHRKLEIEYLNLFAGAQVAEIPSDYMERCKALMLRCFGAPDVASASLARLWCFILRHDKTFACLFADGELESRSALAQQTFFLEGLRELTIIDATIETAVAGIRKQLLLAMQEDAWTEQQTQGWLPCLAALASSYFYHEYLADVDEQEQSIIDSLQQQDDDTTPDMHYLAQHLLLGCYLPLSQLGDTETLASRLESALAALELPDEHKTMVADVITAQLSDYLEEQTLKASIPSLSGALKDSISQQVQAQYERYPYPRWRHLPDLTPCTLQAHLTRLFPYAAQEPAIQAVSQPVTTLVAGCGTGQHPLLRYRTYQMQRILAVDLSFTSLAYAKRMAQQFGIDAIEFLQGDILELDQLDEQFDVVESCGVLHHMHDPMAGWQRICERLKPGGLMNIALYSQTARKTVSDARAVIAKEGYTDDVASMRALRRDIINGGEDHPLASLQRWRDFFTTSQLCDLVFHVQEHQFTIPMIQEALDTLGLAFIGFQFPDHHHKISAFCHRFGADALRDLSAWDTYEQEHPHTFRAMYQFWCYKH